MKRVLFVCESCDSTTAKERVFCLRDPGQDALFMRRGRGISSLSTLPTTHQDGSGKQRPPQ